MVGWRGKETRADNKSTTAACFSLVGEIHQQRCRMWTDPLARRTRIRHCGGHVVHLHSKHTLLMADKRENKRGGEACRDASGVIYKTAEPNKRDEHADTPQNFYFVKEIPLLK